jgi:hypothetical protein
LQWCKYTFWVNLGKSVRIVEPVEVCYHWHLRREAAIGSIMERCGAEIALYIKNSAHRKAKGHFADGGWNGVLVGTLPSFF